MADNDNSAMAAAVKEAWGCGYQTAVDGLRDLAAIDFTWNGLRCRIEPAAYDIESLQSP